MGRPIVEHFNTNIFLNSFVNGEDLFAITEPTGDAISFLLVDDFQSDPTGGFFRLNGIAQENGSQFRVEFEDLANLEYVSGSRIGWEGFRVIAVDVNGDFSTADDSGRLYTVRENVTRPIVRDLPFDALANEETFVAPFVQAFDPDGYPITQFYIRDRLVDNGFLSLDGVPIPQGEFRIVKTEDLDKLTYTTVGGASTDKFDIFAYDGELWSERRTYDVNTIANVNRPVAQFSRGNVESRATLDLAPLSVIIDDDGNSIKWYEFWNTSPHAIHGDLLVNGVVQPRKQWIRVQAEDIGDVQFLAPNRDFVQQIRFRGHDGKFQSANSTISITTTFVVPPIQPEIVSDGLIYDQQLVEYRLDSLFSRTDSGSQTVRYQIYDGNAFDQRSARFELNNDELAAGTIHEFTAAQANQFVRLKTGDFNNRHRDDVLVRVENADGLWSSWEKLIVRTDPEHFTAHDNNSTWNNFDIPRDSAGRMEFTYSFMQDFPDYETGDAEDGDPPEHFTQFTQSARESVRRAFDDFEAVTNVKFVEVSDLSTNTFGGRGGIYRFGNYGDEPGGAAAFAFFPTNAPQGGDSWYDRFDLGQVFFDADDNYIGHIDPQLTPYTFGYFALVHELMHNFGFNHVFDGSGGTGVLPDATQNANFSVLVNGDALRPDVAATTPQLYDVETLQRTYGVNNGFNPGDDTYSLATYWNEQPLFSETLWDGAGIDTLSLEGSDPARGSGAPNEIDLTPGGFSSFNGLLDNVSIAFRATIENAIGSDLADTILGNHVDNVITAGSGNDTIEGAAGNDMLTGGVGNDIFVFGVGDGQDTIDEQRGAGRDRITLSEFPTLDSLEDDLRFTKSGNDLIIDLKLDNSDISDGQIRVVENMFGRNRIETLELNGTAIDLVNLASQLTTAVDQQFQLTADSSVFGALVSPV